MFCLGLRPTVNCFGYGFSANNAGARPPQVACWSHVSTASSSYGIPIRRSFSHSKLFAQGKGRCGSGLAYFDAMPGNQWYRGQILPHACAGKQVHKSQTFLTAANHGHCSTISQGKQQRQDKSIRSHSASMILPAEQLSTFVQRRHSFVFCA
jgi:hypothetical protein